MIIDLSRSRLTSGTICDPTVKRSDIIPAASTSAMAQSAIKLEGQDEATQTWRHVQAGEPGSRQINDAFSTLFHLITYAGRGQARRGGREMHCSQYEAEKHTKESMDSGQEPRTKQARVQCGPNHLSKKSSPPPLLLKGPWYENPTCSAKMTAPNHLL